MYGAPSLRLPGLPSGLLGWHQWREGGLIADSDGKVFGCGGDRRDLRAHRPGDCDFLRGRSAHAGGDGRAYGDRPGEPSLDHRRGGRSRLRLRLCRASQKPCGLSLGLRRLDLRPARGAAARCRRRALPDALRDSGPAELRGGLRRDRASRTTASVALHESLGFALVGVYEQVGFKFGAWHDVGWWCRRIRDLGNRPPEPIPFSSLKAQGS